MELLHILFIGIVLLLIVVSAFFSGSETAVTGISKAKIHQLSKSGDSKASILKKLYANLPHTITTILVANQMTNHVASTIITWITVDTLGESFVPLIATIFGFIIIVYAEIVPKMIAISNTNKYGMLVVGVLDKAVTVMHHVTNVLEFCAKKSLELFGFDINHNKKETGDDEEELKGAIDLHVTGQDEKQEKLLLNNILELDNVEVSNVMVHRGKLFSIKASLTINEAKKIILNCPYTRIPVWKKNPENIIGILHTKTLLKKIASSDGAASNCTVESIATTPWFIPETTRLLNQLQAFKDRHEHFALVVDEYGDLQGVITLEDILEEIVGEIIDEYDVLDNAIKMQEDGSIITNGMVSVRELNRDFEWELPEDEDFSTIAGLVMSRTRNIPNKGAIIQVEGFQIEILKRSKTSINTVKITRLPI